MATLKTNLIEPEGATTTLTVGEAGGDLVVGADSINNNVLQDTGTERVRAFTTVGANTWTCPTGITEVEVLIVAGGGGGGGRYYAGGGGAGGVVHDTDYTVVAGVTYDITVGAAGAGGVADGNGSNGANSVWNVNAEGSGITMTAVGGGGGSSMNGTAGATGSGGGGAGGFSGTPGGAAGQPAVSGATVYANAGGAGAAADAAGGGGAGAAGTAAPNNSSGGAGGIGREFTSFSAYGTDSSNIASTGSNGGYFGGGGGGSGGPSPNGAIAAGGVGGGGAGSTMGPAVDPVAGIVSTGGGGGGASHQTGGGTVGADGGSGVVLIKYNADSPNAIFTSNGSGVLSSVNSAFGSAQVLIQTQTASNQTNVDFTSGITSTYKEYVFEFININPATDNVFFQFQCNINTANVVMTTTYFVAYHDHNDTQNALTYAPSMDQAQTDGMQRLMNNMGNGAEECGAGELHLFNPASTTYVKNFYSTITNFDEGNTTPGREWNGFIAGYCNTTTAITEVRFQMSSGNFDGKIKMYGIK